jgi:elongation factor G
VKEYGPQAIRNCVLVGHGASGKTSLAEAILHFAKATTRLGSVDDGSSHLDYDEEEKKRHISIRAALASFDWNTIHVNLIDTPGYDDFVGEVMGAMRVAGNAIIAVDATAGLAVGAERAFHMARDDGHSILFVTTKLDKMHASFSNVASALKERLSRVAIPVQIPIGEGEKLEGLIDLVHMKAFTFAKDGSGGAKVGDIPASHADAAKAARDALIEAVAEVDDELTEKFFEEGGNLTEEEFTTGLRKGVNQGKLYPILVACGKPVFGVANLLEFISSECSSPLDRPPLKGVDGKTRPRTAEAPMCALVWKTLSEAHVGELSFIRVYSGVLEAGHEVVNSTKGRSEKIGQLFKMVGKERKEVSRVVAGDFACAVKLRESLTGHTLCTKVDPIVLPGIEFPKPIHTVAAHAREKSDEEKMGAGLHRIHEEDPTFHHMVDSETHETILSGMGEIHLDVISARLKERYGVAIELTAPRIPYREAIKGKAREIQGRHKKQTGGRGQFGDVWIHVEPQPRGAGFEFVDDVVGGAVPGKYIPAVEKGVIETLGMGIVAGYPVVDVKVTIYDGSYHAVDSSDMAFKIAGSLAIRKAIQEAKPILLEPIMEVSITTPEDYMGDIMGDLSSRRGKILGMESNGAHQVLKAKVPLAELYRYATHLRSLTQGRGTFSRAFSHYEETPKEIAEKIIAESQTGKKAEEE